MTEDFLHYLWKYKRLFPDLQTTEGEPINIISTGQHNHNAGPDFLEAKIKIGDTLWSGQVEIHKQSSDWFKHKHEKDPAYKNVILHVVLKHDKEIRYNETETIPTLLINDKFDHSLWENYHSLISNKNWVACEKQIASIDSFTIESCLEQTLVERLERKIGEMQNRLSQNKQDWEFSLFQLIGKYLGTNVNAFPFEQLVASIPLSALQKHKNSLLQLEAILFGQAGLLNDSFTEEYPKQLQQEYSFLKHKFNLKPINICWKFLRLRPSNFPTIRIAQLAAILFNHYNLFSIILETSSITQVEKLFRITPSAYWENHYNFDKPSQKKSKKLGLQSIHLLAINVIVPLLFLYGKEKNKPDFQDQAFALLQQIPGEINHITKKWMVAGLNIEHAFHTQALLELKHSYCDNNKCLQCKIGYALLKK